MNTVLNQTYAPIEYIVIDGGSTDGSKTTIEKYADSLTYWVSEKDNGVYHAMNKGIAKATGDYILFLNSGDYFIDTTSVEKALSYNYEEDILYGDIKTKDGLLTYPDELNFFYFFRHSIGHPAAFIKSSLFEKYGNYNEQNKIVSDWQFFLEVIIKHKVSYKHIPEVISYFDTNGMSSAPAFQNELNKEMIAVLQPYLDEYYGEVVEGISAMKNEIQAYKKKELKRTLKYKLYKVLGKKNKLS